MKAQPIRIGALALVAVSFFVSGCAPECVDFSDCADKGKAAQAEFTCDNGVCKAGSPFPGVDAGSAGGGTGGGTTGGGGGATGGGGGSTGGGGGSTGGGGGSTGGGGGSTGGGGGTTGGGGGTSGPQGAYTASLSAAQAVPASASTDTGAGTFTLSALSDGGYNLAWSVTHTIGGGGISGGLKTGLAGFPGTNVVAFSSFASPITGSLDLADPSEIAGGRVFVSLSKANNEIRGQIIPAGNRLWTAQLNTSTPGTTFGGAQFVAPTDGGLVSYLGEWTSDVVPTASHIHQGGAAGTGAVIVPLSLTADGGGLSGTFDPATLAAGDTDGGLYVNVHTSGAPGWPHSRADRQALTAPRS